eukprot:4451074-Pyramimonas_sp.AAC.1
MTQLGAAVRPTPPETFLGKVLGRFLGRFQESWNMRKQPSKTTFLRPSYKLAPEGTRNRGTSLRKVLG